MPDQDPLDIARAAHATEAAGTHWRRNLRFSGTMLALWFGVTFVTAYFARELDAMFFGWPLGFWVAAQGAILVYIAIVVAYARRMARLDRDCGLEEGD